MFDARKGQITITRGDTGLLAIVPTGYVPTSQDRMFFMVAEMPDGRIVINKTVTPDDDGVCKLMFSGTDTENLSKRHREYTYAIRFALDVTESNGKITGYREMITPEPPGCFVVLEANGCLACTCETKNVGSMEVKLESFRGPQGPKGEKGDKGDTGAKGEPGKDAVIDATLTREGAAADAAATGKRLEEIEKAVAEKADKARQNILIGSETGNPVSASDAFSAPLCGLTVYGKSTQDGTPTPDAPVPIVSAGDGGAITVTISDGADEQKTITLQTPNGLPGIPVASGGNYTDPQGQQWVCDEVDLERGVRVQRVDKGAFDSTKALAEQNAILATPVEAPLTPDELTAYKALTTYAPDTVVQAADGAGLKLDYQRDVNIVIKNLEDAVASMTTT